MDTGIRTMKWLIVAFIIVIIGTILFLGSMLLEKETGTITGTVTIGPLCPVEPCNLTPAQIAAAYAARRILVFDENLVPVGEVSIGADGHYAIAVPAGRYTVDLKPSGIDRSPDVPALVSVPAGGYAVLDIDIDTGIR